jgi:hypothetical protein
VLSPVTAFQALRSAWIAPFFSSGQDIFNASVFGFTPSKVVFSAVDQLFVAGSNPSNNNQANSLAFSRDGISWTGMGRVLVKTKDLTKVEELGFWIVVGDSIVGGPGIATSSTGTGGWNVLNVQAAIRGLGPLSAIAFGNSRFVVGSGNGFAFSSDLVTWANVSTGPYTTVGNGGSVTGFCFFNSSTLVMKTGDSAVPLALSTDLATFVPQPTSIINLGGTCKKIGSQMVVVGRSTGFSPVALSFSQDLITWNSATATLNLLSQDFYFVEFDSQTSRFFVGGGVSAGSVFFAPTLAATVWTPVTWIAGGSPFGGNTA